MKEIIKNIHLGFILFGASISAIMIYFLGPLIIIDTLTKCLPFAARIAAKALWMVTAVFLLGLTARKAIEWSDKNNAEHNSELQPKS
jgi:hypothetical protein